MTSPSPEQRPLISDVTMALAGSPDASYLNKRISEAYEHIEADLTHEHSKVIEEIDRRAASKADRLLDRFTRVLTGKASPEIREYVLAEANRYEAVMASQSMQEPMKRKEAEAYERRRFAGESEDDFRDRMFIEKMVGQTTSGIKHASENKEKDPQKIRAEQKRQAGERREGLIDTVADWRVAREFGEVFVHLGRIIEQDEHEFRTAA